MRGHRICLRQGQYTVCMKKNVIRRREPSSIHGTPRHPYPLPSGSVSHAPCPVTTKQNSSVAPSARSEHREGPAYLPLRSLSLHSQQHYPPLSVAGLCAERVAAPVRCHIARCSSIMILRRRELLMPLQEPSPARDRHPWLAPRPRCRCCAGPPSRRSASPSRGAAQRPRRSPRATVQPSGAG